MAEPLRILHLSDTHLFGDGTRHYGVVDTTEALDRVLERAAEVDRLDLVVCSGDLSDDGSPASYRLLRDRIEAFAEVRGAAVAYAMGNHDGRAGFEEVLGSRVGVLDVRGVRVIRLDTSVPGFGSGRLEADQLAWLREQLTEPAPHGTIVVVHHPPTPASSALLAALELRDPRALLDACGTGDVRLILGGHYHHARTAIEQGLPVAVAPGVANTSDPFAPAGRERALVGSGFAVVELPEAGAARVTAVAVAGPDDGRELFDLGPDEVERIARSAAEPA
ncbi:metallophosphoesterase [Pseudolysinimonas sp.]|uniref:metallophosphoesterase n=1 Tax=Pseudolysinimonas sp. TaxID=2680009 RepID=UPI003F814D30